MLEAKTVHLVLLAAFLTPRSQMVLVQGFDGNTMTWLPFTVVLALVSATGALVSICTQTESFPGELKQSSEMLAQTLTLYDWPLPKQLS